MKRLLLLLLLILSVSVAIGCVYGSSPADDAAPAQASGADTGLVFVVVSGNRLYPDWSEEQSVRLGEEFFIGDTDFTGMVTEFLPDFRIKDGKPISLTDEMTNPAVRVFVQNDTAVVDSSWAFLNFPPHFSPYSFYTFQLKEILADGQSATGDAAARIEQIEQADQEEQRNQEDQKNRED